MIDVATGERFARVALGHVTLEYPNKLDHVLESARDLRAPHALHPIFYGSFDWHSSVHAYWLLATLYRHVPDLVQRPAIRELFDSQLTVVKVAKERAYLAHPARGTFERPYGWAWLLMLAAELARHTSDEGRTWATRLTPLAEACAERFRQFLPRATYPVRAGTHANTAFAVALGLEYAEVTGDAELAGLLRASAVRWYGNDVGCQAWEPGGDDFLSPALIEAECMRRVLPAGAWHGWFDRFLPWAAAREPAALFEPAVVSDRTDGKIAHLDGLNLSRAWCWRQIAAGLPADDRRKALFLDTAAAHLAASLPHLADDYAGEHWLATYALLACLSGI